MALYAKEDAPAWSYVGIDDPAYQWRFIETEPMYGNPAFYLQNVGTGMYISKFEALSTPLIMVPDANATQPYRIDIHSDTEMTISDANWSDANLHFNNHSGGANAFGNVVHWNSTVGTASAIFIVEPEKYINDLVNNIEEMECIDEYVAPAKKGIFDLFGRRIDTPAATGIYIVDGKKRVIKK